MAGLRYMTHGSDEVRGVSCEQCDQHGTTSDAAGFCVECVEYMCQMCLKYHKRYMPTHTQQDASTMPQDLAVTEKCSSHPRFLIKYFCETCEKLACLECKMNEHNNCALVSHVSVLGSNKTNKLDNEELKDQIANLTESLDGLKAKLTINMEKLEIQEASAKHGMKLHGKKLLNSLRDMKQEMVNDYDAEIKDLEETLKEIRQSKSETVEIYDAKLVMLERNLKSAETDMVRVISRTKCEDQIRLQGIEKLSTKITGQLGQIACEMEQRQKSDQRCDTFIEIRKTEEILTKVEEELEKLNTSNKTCDYNVEPVVESLTFETVDSIKGFFAYKETEEPCSQTVASLDTQLQIQQVNYASLCVLPDNKLVLTDHKNSSLYVFQDIRQSQPVAFLIPASPWGIARVSDEKVVVTFPELGLVNFFVLSEAMQLVQNCQVKVGYDCYGVACGHDRLIVSYLNPAKVQVLDMAGNVLRVLEKSSDQMPLFSSPRHVTLSSNKRLVYVSDSARDTVTCMTFTGKVKAVYKDEQLITPFQLTTDEEGNVYVCGRGSNNIHQLTSELKKMTILIDEKHELSRPVALGLWEEANKLYIGMFGASCLKVFRLSRE